ncbi:hypothetical protein PYCC9005_000177 [Savitreella phatthalungensis]
MPGTRSSTSRASALGAVKVETAPDNGLFLPETADQSSDEELMQDEDDEIHPPSSAVDGTILTATGLRASEEIVPPGSAIPHADDAVLEDDNTALRFSDPTNDDDDDPIEYSYDLFSAPAMADTLHLLQYPMRPRDQAYRGAETPAGARFKAKTGWLEVDVPIPETQFYDTENADRWTSKWLKQQTIGGKIVGSRHYAVGVRYGDEIHLIPVAGVAQLRPLFKHVDQRDENDRATRYDGGGSGGAGAGGQQGEGKPVPTSRAVQVSAKSGDNASQETGNAAALKAYQEEPWLDLGWSPIDAESKDMGGDVTSLLARRREPCHTSTEASHFLSLLSTNKPRTTKTRS